MQKHRGLFHLRVYESAEGVAWFASFQRKRTYYLPWNFYFLMQIVKNQIFMKHFLLTLLLTFIVGVCSAQTEHMKFKGVPMEGTLQTFTSKLKAKGFMPIGVQDGVSLLKGEFAGYKDCTIGAVADKSGMICKVSVIFPAMDKWGDLERCYLNYKSMLSEKYGAPQRLCRKIPTQLCQ